MLISMTGYGRNKCDLPNMVYSIEIKSLNSKQLDTSVKVPVLLRDKEMEMRNMLNTELLRGKVELSIYYEPKESASGYSINQPVVKKYLKQLAEIAGEAGMEETERNLQVAMRLPDAMKSVKDELGKEDWKLVKQAIQKALDELVSFRRQEGKALEKDISLRVNSILDKLDRIEPFEEERINRVRKRIAGALADLKKDVPADNGRLEQEMIFYLEKMDITEEKVRLRNHCQYFCLLKSHQDQNNRFLLEKNPRDEHKIKMDLLFPIEILKAVALL